MTLKRKIAIAALSAAALVSVIFAGRILVRHVHPPEPIVLTGAILKQDNDPQKQTPLADVNVAVVTGKDRPVARSSSSGLFVLKLRPGFKWNDDDELNLSFTHPQYKPLKIAVVPGGRLYVVRMEQIAVEAPKAQAPRTGAKPNVSGKLIPIRNVRVRYSIKEQHSTDVGTVAKQFEVVSKGNVSCAEQPCSPDGKWKQETGSLTLDAGEGNEYRNLRVSCISGPCPFTKVEPDSLDHAQQKVTITARDWSDSASFLVEAEVIRTVTSDRIQISYPFIIERTMSFALPAGSEGPSIEADLGGQQIVFPLGPALILTWANCSMENPPGHNKIYRCELKPGYEFAAP